MELVLIGTALGLTGIVWVSRAHYGRRFNAALDAYTKQEILRQRLPYRRPGTTSR
jgi:hypothetical protein